MRGAGVTVGHVVELEGAAARACGTAANGGLHAGACVQHLPYAVGGDVGARQEHEQHGGHEHGYEDLDQVGDVGGQGADLHQPGVHAQAAEPEDGDGAEVQHQTHEREHGGHPLAHVERDVGELAVGLPEALGFVRLANEGADDADTADLLAHDLVHPVDALLHHLEARHRPPDDEAHGGGQHGHRYGHQPGEAHVLSQGHDQPTHGHDGGGDQHREGHVEQGLDLQHVVGVAREQRGGAEAGDLAGGELGDVVEDAGAQVAAEGHGHAGAQVDGAYGAGHLQERHEEHDAAALQDVARVPENDAAVDDVGVDARQQQGGDGGQELQGYDQPDGPAVGARVA